MINEQPQTTHTGEEVHQAAEAELFTGIVGMFDAPHAANKAFEALLELGYHPNEVGIMIAESTKRRFYLPSLLTHPVEAEVHSSTAPTGAADEATKEEVKRSEAPERKAMLQGAGAVSAVGALGGILVAGTAAVFLPGLGLLLLGPLAGLGAGFGALVGGVYAVPTMENEHAQMLARYESEVKAGRVLIHVTPHTPEDEIRIRKEWDRIQGVTS